MKLDLNKEEGKLLELAQGNKEICELIKHAFVKLREGREKIVNSDISKIENKGKGAIPIAKELARVAYLSKPENIYFVVRYGTLLLKDDDVDGAEEVVRAYKSKHGDSSHRFKFLEASIHKNKERYDKAIAILQKLDKDQYVIDELAECYYLSRNYADAKSLLENNQLSWKSALILAKIYKQEGFPQKAYKVLEPFRGKDEVDTFIDGLGPIDIASKSEAETSLWIEKGIQKFKKEHDPSKTVLVMMKFSGGDPSKDKKLETLFNTIKLELDKYGLDTVRADEKNYSESDYIWDNVQIYLNGCNYGIAVLENLYSEEMNPNVALEYGYMLAKGKRVLLLKEKSFRNIRADILGKIWKEFEFDDHKSIKKAIQKWMVDLGITRIKA